MNDIDNKLDEKLGNAPRNSIGRADLWPGVAARIQRRPMSPLLLSAAAAVLFVAGMIAGNAQAARDPGGDATATASTPFLAAVAVQESGSAYLAALGRLRDISADSGARNQGYEAALVVMAAAAEEVASATALPADGLTSEVRRARDAWRQTVYAGKEGGQ